MQDVAELMVLEQPPRQDAELDRAQGKLSAADWERIDAELRREAIALLKRIDAARGRFSD